MILSDPQPRRPIPNATGRARAGADAATDPRALADVDDGAIDRAADRLTESFATVCEREEPPTVSVDGRPVACHRHVD